MDVNAEGFYLNCLYVILEVCLINATNGMFINSQVVGASYLSGTSLESSIISENKVLITDMHKNNISFNNYVHNT